MTTTGKGDVHRIPSTLWVPRNLGAGCGGPALPEVLVQPARPAGRAFGCGMAIAGITLIVFYVMYIFMLVRAGKAIGLLANVAQGTWTRAGGLENTSRPP